PEPGGRGFKPSGGGFEPGREDPKPSGEGRKPSGGGRKPSGEGRKPSRGSSKPHGRSAKPVGKPGGGDPITSSRRETGKEDISLAKRYPLPDEELWEEEQQLGIQPRPWPAPGTLPIPPGFPARAFEDAVSAWSCLQLFGTLMHLRRFSLNELMVALVEGTESSTIDSNGASSSSWDHEVQAPTSQLPQGPDPPLADPASLVDIIPPPQPSMRPQRV
ncbi:unnamed protein product, partial [Ascophyllum nodosum]